MAYLLVSDFKNGIDRRRPRKAGVAGSLWMLRNGVISRGGDIEKAKRFIPLYSVPNTFGLAQINGQIFVFGSAVQTVPAGLQYQRLQSPSGAAMVRVLDVKAISGKAYAIAEFADGGVFHFYDGARVAQWDTIATNVANNTTLAAYLAERAAIDPNVRVTAAGASIVMRAKDAGVPFTLAATGATVVPVQANVAAVANVDAAGSVTLTAGSADVDQLNRVEQIKVDGVSLLAAPVPFVASLSATANAVAVAINNGTTVHGYNATAVGASVQIKAPPLLGAATNGRAVVFTGAGNVTATAAPLAGGVTAVAPIAQVSRVDFTGTFSASATYSITLNGVEHKSTGLASGMGTSIFVNKLRAYSVVQSLIYYSALNAPTDWSTVSASSGAGFLNIAAEASNIGRLQAMARYNTLIAVFGRETIFTYTLATDATANKSEQPLENTGTIAPASIVTYGSSDVFYLDETGIRSLRARDSSNAAFVSDIGTVVDPFIAELRAATPPEVVQRAQAVVEPVDGRYWLAIGDTIVVLSNFPSAKITAWSVLKPGFVPTAFVRSRREVYARSADTVYVYGGLDGDEPVGANQTVAETPFLDGGTPATIKQIVGYDISCEGVWHLEMLVDPNDETKVVDLGRAVGSTMHKARISINQRTSAFAIRATCESEGNASISMMAVHYDAEKAT